MKDVGVDNKDVEPARVLMAAALSSDEEVSTEDVVTVLVCKEAELELAIPRVEIADKEV